MNRLVLTNRAKLSDKTDGAASSTARPELANATPG